MFGMEEACLAYVVPFTVFRGTWGGLFGKLCAGGVLGSKPPKPKPDILSAGIVYSRLCRENRTKV